MVKAKVVSKKQYVYAFLLISISFPVLLGVNNIAFYFDKSVFFLNEVGLVGVLALLAFYLLQGVVFALLWCVFVGLPIGSFCNTREIKREQVVFFSILLTSIIYSLIFLSIAILVGDRLINEGVSYAYGVITTIIIGAVGGFGLSILD